MIKLICSFDSMIEINNHITISKQIRFGKPTIKGTRIAVADVLTWLSEGKSMPDIIEDFPQLAAENIIACLKYAASKENKLVIA